ncbi:MULTISPECIES: hypothetical protein [Streptomyces]|uniref:hypothetical protein n=1 Tax=Streptomyces TaxID=1883 RepID=UPI000F718BE8|nr:hypothetical protein [Streptomyces sp. W1SF4]AZM90275.1 hypothetical protein D1J60_18970 [Streptomyces sp. W1SF4]
MNEWLTDPYRFPGLRSHPYDDDAEAGAPVDAWPGPSPAPGPPPAPARRPGADATPDSADRRRLDLHTWLTSAGVRPHTDDPHAIAVLSTVDDTTHAALRRWITGGL